LYEQHATNLLSLVVVAEIELARVFRWETLNQLAANFDGVTHIGVIQMPGDIQLYDSRNGDRPRMRDQRLAVEFAVGMIVLRPSGDDRVFRFRNNAGFTCEGAGDANEFWRCGSIPVDVIVFGGRPISMVPKPAQTEETQQNQTG